MVTTAKKLRFDTKEVFNSISRGEEVLITYRGKAYAKLIPVQKISKRKIEPSGLFGIWNDYVKVNDVDNYVRELRGRRKNIAV